MSRLRKGDVFLLCERHYVMLGNFNIQVGRVYNRGKDRSKVRSQLTISVTDILHKNGIEYDKDLIDRFANYVAKDIQPGKFRLPMGHFVVTEVDSSGNSTEETVHCKRFHPLPGENEDVIRFNQNKFGTGQYPHNVLFSLGDGEY
ncbi:hypothetical protein [Dyadobacter soli]|nr:hypothetical protein [Dyadobacter soli]